MPMPRKGVPRVDSIKPHKSYLASKAVLEVFEQKEQDFPDCKARALKYYRKHLRSYELPAEFTDYLLTRKGKVRDYPDLCVAIVVGNQGQSCGCNSSLGPSSKSGIQENVPRDAKPHQQGGWMGMMKTRKDSE
eukprot:3824746-Rhodomonas_salina.2